MGRYDATQTANNAREFFKNDFWHYMNEGGMHPDQLSNQLNSPTISAMPVNHSNLNGTERSLVRTLSKAEKARYLAEVILIAVWDCTNVENRKHRDLLMAKYINRLSVKATEVRLNFSDYQLKTEQKKALCEFAERFNYWRAVMHCQDDLPDLICQNATKKQLESN